MKSRTPAAVKLKAGAGYFARVSYIVKVKKEGYEGCIQLPAPCGNWMVRTIILWNW